MSAANGAAVLVDLGRSHVRVVAGDTVDVRIDGGAGLTDPAGPVGAAGVVASALHAAGVALGGARMAVCAPGVVTSPELARTFAGALAALSPAPAEVLVVSDSAAWQAGTFTGRDGAVVALGTGAVVVARDGAALTRLDGLGLLLGDVGGGAWIGQEALRRAVRGAAGLRRVAVSRLGPVSGWASLLGAADLPARLAAFVPDVDALARAGDPDAGAVLEAAADGVAATLAPLRESLPVCLVGGVAAVLQSRLRARTPGRTWVHPQGDAVDGLRLLLDDPGPFAGESMRIGPATDRAARHDTDLLPTEAVAPGTEELDTWPTPQLVERLVRGHASAVPAVLGATAGLARAAELAGRALAGTGRLVYVGAGTPGRLAVQDAAELVPTFDIDPARAIVLLAGGDRAGVAAVEGAEDDATAGARAVDLADVGGADVVVGISASGRTPYVLAALTRAAARGAATVGVASVAGSPLARLADVAVELPTGPEVVAGSTRMAAGTAQKIALNTLSTAALIRAGATFGPWMVDVRASNDKLRRRCLRIVRDAAGVDEDTARRALDDADGTTTVALIMLLAGVDAGTARRRLAEGGSVRGALRERAACG